MLNSVIISIVPDASSSAPGPFTSVQTVIITAPAISWTTINTNVYINAFFIPYLFSLFTVNCKYSLKLPVLNPQFCLSRYLVLLQLLHQCLAVLKALLSPKAIHKRDGQ